MVRTFTAAVHQEEDWYVARCLELDCALVRTTRLPEPHDSLFGPTKHRLKLRHPGA
jgi:hypothetical protein